MRITTVNDLNTAGHMMHDSEFTDKDFGFDERTRTFFLETTGIDEPVEVFRLELFNVVAWNPVNLDRVRRGEALGGVFNKIQIRHAGREVTIVSQDLRIELELSDLDGRLLSGTTRDQLSE